jgi:hypothetical protein
MDRRPEHRLKETDPVNRGQRVDSSKKRYISSTGASPLYSHSIIIHHQYVTSSENINPRLFMYDPTEVKNITMEFKRNTVSEFDGTRMHVDTNSRVSICIRRCLFRKSHLVQPFHLKPASWFITKRLLWRVPEKLMGFLGFFIMCF